MTLGSYTRTGRSATMQDEEGNGCRSSLRADADDTSERRTPRVSWANECDLVTMLGEELRDVLAENDDAPASKHHQPSHPAAERGRDQCGDNKAGELAETRNVQRTFQGLKTCVEHAPSSPTATPRRNNDVITTSPSSVTFYWDQRWSQIASLIDKGLGHDAGPTSSHNLQAAAI